METRAAGTWYSLEGPQQGGASNESNTNCFNSETRKIPICILCLSRAMPGKNFSTQKVHVLIFFSYLHGNILVLIYCGCSLEFRTTLLCCGYSLEAPC